MAKTKEQEFDIDKVYEFELIKTHDLYQPKEKNHPNVSMRNGYPPMYILANSGNAFDDETQRIRAWRLITGQPSIWIDQQEGLDRIDRKEIATMLAQPENQIEFIKGKLTIPGTQALKLKALHVMDDFAGKERKARAGKDPIFRLNKEEEIVELQLAAQEKLFDAMALAKGANDTDMLSYAYGLGIDVNNTSPGGLAKIRALFNAKAQENPGDFIKRFDDQKNRIKYLFHSAMQEGIISATQIPNTLTWAENQVPIFEVSSNGDVVLQLSEKVMSKDKEALKVLEAIKGMLQPV